MEIRKAKLEKPWPPSDRQVGVILVAHSMGGFVASEALFHMLDERATSDNPTAPLFPLIQGILTFDTPYNGLARSMFVYGAFSNYQKVSSVFNVMTALSAAPASLGMALKRGATSLPGASSVGRGASGAVAGPAAWKTWQLVAVRTGTVGAIAAGGVAAYVHRQKIMDGIQSARNMKKEDLVEGYNQSVDRLGHGLAYVNRGNVGQSFAWLSDHFTFVGVLMKQQELNKRLERLTALGGVGVHDMYASMGENGYWSGGYFVPERTFCAIPAEDQPASNLFSRHVVKKASDEIQAHMSMFMPDRNEEYQLMVKKSSALVTVWFNDDSEIVDDPKITQPEPADAPESKIKATDEGVELEGQEGVVASEATQDSEESNEMPDESPLDIAAAASLIPLPTDADGDSTEATTEVKDKQNYMRYLMGIAQNAGTGVQQAGTSVKGYFPSKLPTIPTPSMPRVPTPSMPSMPSMTMPKVGLFSRKEKAGAAEDNSTAANEQPSEEVTQKADGEEASNPPVEVVSDEQATSGGKQANPAEISSGDQVASACGQREDC
ncbi:hypothetical protein N0V93_010061 [Gnomoniopsis smithogilvyi]|uniref:Uncharacterized protein n=1 Tax=Gnomoniopsis smithogilvyi TaxID=1191159 RepID=A0A9W9CT20_9PEZI|nr:hypothetical protein N0V93_010061 [Gnomoniopsis smithogilvyi]